MDNPGKETRSHLDGGYGWVVVAAQILINASVLPLIQCFGIIFDKEFKEMGVTASETSFLLHLYSSINYVFSFFCSPLLKTYSFRTISIIGSSIMTLGILLTSFANSYGFLIFSVSIVIGLGQSILMPATYIAVNAYFEKKLTLATSFSVTGASLSPVFMPKVCDILLTHLGRRYTVLVLFAISFISIFSCLLLKPVRSKVQYVRCDIANDRVEIPEEVQNSLLEQKTDEIYKGTTVPIKKDTFMSKMYSLFDLELIKNRSYVLVVIGLGISYAAEQNIVLMMQFLLPELSNFTRSDVAYGTSVQSIFDIIGRLAIPLLGHLGNITPNVMYASTLLVAILARIVLAIWCQQSTIVYISIGFLGLTKGSRAVFQSVIIPKMVLKEKLPAANGINMLFAGTISLIIGPIIGAIHDAAGSYIYALHAASSLSALCVLLWLVEYICTKNKAVPKKQLNCENTKQSEVLSEE